MTAPINIPVVVTGTAQLTQLANQIRNVQSALTYNAALAQRTAVSNAQSVYRERQAYIRLRAAITEATTVPRTGASNLQSIVAQRRALNQLFTDYKTQINATGRATMQTGLRGAQSMATMPVGMVDATSMAQYNQGVQQSFARAISNADMLRLRMGLLRPALSNFATHITTIGKNAQWTGRQLMMGLTLPVVMAIRKTTSLFLAVSKEMTKIRKVSGIQSESKWAQISPTLEKNIGGVVKKFGIAQKEVAKLTADVVAMGYSIKGASSEASKMTEQIAFTSTLGDIGLSTARDFYRTMLKVFGQSAEGTRTFNDQLKATNFIIDQLNQIENKTVINLNQLADAMPKAAGAAKLFGLNGAELATVLTGIYDKGIALDTAATGLNFILTRILNPTKQAQEYFDGAFGAGSLAKIQQMGNGMEKLIKVSAMYQELASKGGPEKANVAEAGRVFSELVQRRQIKTFVPLANSINIGMKQIRTSIQQNAVVNQAALSRGIDPMIASYEELTPILREYRKELLDSQYLTEGWARATVASAAYANSMTDSIKSLAEEFAKMSEKEVKIKLEAPETQFAILKESFKMLGAELGKALLPSLLFVMGKLESFFSKLSNMADPLKKLIAGFAVFLAALGPVVYIAGTATTAFGLLFKALVGLLPGIQAVSAEWVASQIALGNATAVRNVAQLGDSFYNLQRGSGGLTAAILRLAGARRIDAAAAAAEAAANETLGAGQASSMRRMISTSTLYQGLRRRMTQFSGRASALPTIAGSQAAAAEGAVLTSRGRNMGFANAINRIRNGLRPGESIDAGAATARSVRRSMLRSIFSRRGQEYATAEGGAGRLIANMMPFRTRAAQAVGGSVRNVGAAALSPMVAVGRTWGTILSPFRMALTGATRGLTGFGRGLGGVIAGPFRSMIAGARGGFARASAGQYRTPLGAFAGAARGIVGGGAGGLISSAAGGLGSIAGIAATLGTVLGPLLVIVPLIVGAIVFIKKLIDNWDKVSAGMQKGLGALKKAWNQLMEVFKSVGKIFSDAMGTLEASTTNAGGRSVSIWEQIGNVIGSVLSFVGTLIKAFGNVVKALAPVFKWIANVVASQFNIIINVVKAVAAAFKGDGAKAGEYLQRAFLYAIRFIVGLAKPFTNFINFLVKLTLKAVGLIIGTLAKIPGLGGVFKGLANSVQKLSKSFNITSTIDKWLDNSLKKRKVQVGVEVVEDVKRRQSMVGNEPDKENLPTGGATDKNSGKDAWENFLSALKSKLDDFISKLKDMISKAFDEVWAARLKVYDDQIKAIDDLQKKEDELLATEEYNQNRREALNKRALDQQNYVRNRALAIYEGRIDDARMLDLDFSETSRNNNKAITDLDAQRSRELIRAQREISKQRINDARAAAEERKKIEEDSLKEQIDLITQYTPRTGLEWENMMNNINNVLTQYGIPKIVGAWNDGLSMFTLAVAQINNDMKQESFWKGEWVDDAIATWYEKILGWDIKGLMKQKTQEAAAGVAEGSGGGGGTGTEDTPETGTPEAGKRPFSDEEKAALRTKIAQLQQARGAERQKIFESLSPAEVEFLKGEKQYDKYRTMATGADIGSVTGIQSANLQGLQSAINDRNIRTALAQQNQGQLEAIVATPVTEQERRWKKTLTNWQAQNPGKSMQDFIDWYKTQKDMQNTALYEFLFPKKGQYKLPPLSKLDKSPLTEAQNKALDFVQASLKNTSIPKKRRKAIRNQIEREMRTFGRVLTNDERKQSGISPILEQEAANFVPDAFASGNLTINPDAKRQARRARALAPKLQKLAKVQKRLVNESRQLMLARAGKLRDSEGNLLSKKQQKGWAEYYEEKIKETKADLGKAQSEIIMVEDKFDPKLIAARRARRRARRREGARNRRLQLQQLKEAGMTPKEMRAQGLTPPGESTFEVDPGGDGKPATIGPARGRGRRRGRGRGNGDENLRTDVKAVSKQAKTDSEFIALMKILGLQEGLFKNKNILHESEKRFMRGGLDSVKDYLGIESPSKKYADSIGKPIAQGIAKGVKAPSSVKKLTEAFDDLLNPFLNFTRTVRFNIRWDVHGDGTLKDQIQELINRAMGSGFNIRTNPFAAINGYLMEFWKAMKTAASWFDRSTGFVGREGNRLGPQEQWINQHPPVALATGGIIKRRSGGILAQIGEGRYDEAVIPLPNGLKNFTNSFRPASVSMGTFEGSMQSAMVKAMKECAPYMGGEGSGEINIYVDNFIGQPQWFESMMSEYGVKVAPNKQRSYGTINRKITSYQDNNYRTGRV
jgi:TP901 family phage tail tape measure protein